MPKSNINQRTISNLPQIRNPVVLHPVTNVRTHGPKTSARCSSRNSPRKTRRYNKADSDPKHGEYCINPDTPFHAPLLTVCHGIASTLRFRYRFQLMTSLLIAILCVSNMKHLQAAEQ